MRRILISAVVLVLLGAAAGAVIYKTFPAQMAKHAGMAFNFYRSFGAPKGNFYALNAATGEKLWGQHIGGGIGGGVITYSAGGSQKVALAAGFTSPMWPTKIATAKVVVLGLDNAARAQ